MSAVLPTDKTLVNRAGVNHSASADMSTVQDTDLLLVNRAGVDYKCTFADWKNSQVKPPNSGAVTLADVAGGDRFTSVAFPVSATMTEDGVPTSTKKLKAYVEGTLKSSAQTSAITSIAPQAPTYQISRSLRFNGIASLTRTSYAGTGTIALWYKSDQPNTAQTIMAGLPQVTPGNNDWNFLLTTGVTPAAIGSGFKGYLADVQFVDAQTLADGDFRNPDGTPKAYAGTYGTNGFHLPFSDNSTAAALGTDTSGNGNNWMPNNFSVSNTSTDYSTGLVAYNSAAGIRTVVNPEYIFDGIEGNYAQGDFVTLPGQFDYILCNFSPALTGVTSVRIKAWDGDNSGTRPMTATVNGQSTGVTGGNGGGVRWYDLTPFLGGTTLSQVKLQAGAIGGAKEWRSNLHAIEVNGVVLQDPQSGSDSLVDSPTNYGTDTGAGGEVRGNYATLNPLLSLYSTPPKLMNGNLDYISSRGIGTTATMGMSSGKWYCEVSITSSENMVGIYRGQSAPGVHNFLGAQAEGYSYYSDSGHKYNGNSHSAYGASYTSGDVIGIAFDAVNGTLGFYKNGVSQGTAFSGLTSGPYFFAFGNAISTGSFNFGQRPFAYTAPSGFMPLVELPDMVLTLADNTSLASFAPNDAVTEVGNSDDGTGTVKSVNAAGNTLTLSGLPIGWDVGSAVKGPPKPAANVRLYCKLNAAGAVSDLQSADPGFTAWTPAGTGPYTGRVTFPAKLPTGHAPDVDLPEGTALTVEVQATNTSGTDTSRSNTVTPI